MAEASGITTSYWDGLGEHHEVPPSTLRAVLAAMGVVVGDGDGEDANPAAGRLGERDEGAAGAAPLPGTGGVAGSPGGQPGWPRVLVVRAGSPWAWTHPDSGRVRLALESGATELLDRGEALPADLPFGYHWLMGEEEAEGARTQLIVAPPNCWLPPELASGQERWWGWTLQLYALRSRSSWGVGDLHDLDELLADKRSGGRLGAAFALVNPVHAPIPGEPSPYFPSSRVFRDPLYLHIEWIPEARRLHRDDRARLEQLVAAGHRLNYDPLISRDRVRALKEEALHLCFSTCMRDPERRAALAAWRAARPEVDRFATFRALQARFPADWREWPEAYRHPGNPEVARLAAALPHEVTYHAYVQFLLDEQMQRLQHAGGRIGVINDLAIGFAPSGFDAWTFQDTLATGFTIGAPPDPLGPQGQDWGLPALNPLGLAEVGYRPFVETIRSGMAHAGGLRIDHVMGLFRLFWIPEGQPPTAGTYVRYPAGDLLGILALESHRAQALVIGEDLGTVEPGVRERLAAERALSYRVAWFEQDEDNTGPRPAATYPPAAMATVTTHDLPTTHGFFTDADLAERQALGLIPDEHYADTLAGHHWRRGELHALLVREGLLEDWQHDPETVTEALYAFLARTPSMLMGVSPDDVLGALRRPNVPGTTTERPNWSLPLPVPLDELLDDSRVKRLAESLRVNGR
jgi:4-alpha-glucanotransferase